MKVFLAGGVSGNLYPMWRKIGGGTPLNTAYKEFVNNENISCRRERESKDNKSNSGGNSELKLYLAGGESRHWIHGSTIFRKEEDEDILCREHNIPSLYSSDINRRGGSTSAVKDENIHSRHSSLWGGKAEYYTNAIKEHKPYILESFYYADETTEKLLPYFGDFLLDSGAFTFMQNAKSGAKIQWEDYIERYADFINRNHIEKFFELDIDSIVGYNKVLQYRAKLEKLTNKQCIPVWHISRGYDEYKRMCDEYNYSAIGGVVIKEIKPQKYGIFPAMIAEAHKRKCKVHGLGFTSLAWLPKCHFDSVDSTSWTTGNRFGFLYKFNGKTMEKIDVPKGYRFSKDKVREVALSNYVEWIKFQRYAERNL